MSNEYEEIEAFKRDCRVKAIHIARDMRPPINYANNTQQALAGQARYDLLKEAELIYQWLISDTTS